MMQLEINREYLAQSIRLLKNSPDKERVILWLGREEIGRYVVEEVMLPIQMAEEDFFYIPKEGMTAIMTRLRKKRMALVAQVHTHPSEAYHSSTDDEWAIVRHQNAYSLVLPYFCSETTVANFLQEVATFVLNTKNHWEEVSNKNLIIV